MKLSRWMKKHPAFGRVLIAIIAVIMIISLMIPAAALADEIETSNNDTYDGTPSITIEGVDSTLGDEYVAYQIFATDTENQSTSSGGKTNLKNYQFSDSINDDARLEIDSILSVVGNNLSDGEVKAILDGYTASQRDNFAEKMINHFTTSSSFSGYNFVVNGDEAVLDLSGAGKTGDGITVGTGLWAVGRISSTGYLLNSALVEVINDAKISFTTPQPVLTKAFKNDAAGKDLSFTDEFGGDYAKVFLRSDIPDNLNDYQNFKMIFTDTLSDGLLFDDNSKQEKNIIVTLGSASSTPAKEITDGKEVINWTVEFRNNVMILSITNFDLLKQFQGHSIEIEYQVKLDPSNMQGDNFLYATSHATLEYTSDKAGVETTVIEQPGLSTVYTYKLVGDVVTDGDEPLHDATFKIGAKDGWLNVVGSTTPGKYYIDGFVAEEDEPTTFKTDENGHFEIVGIDLDERTPDIYQYQVNQVSTDEGYVAIEDPMILNLEASMENAGNEDATLTITGDGGSDNVFIYEGNQVKFFNEKYVDPDAITPMKVIQLLFTIVFIVAVVIGVRKFLAWRRDQYGWEPNDSDEFRDFDDDELSNYTFDDIDEIDSDIQESSSSSNNYV